MASRLVRQGGLTRRRASELKHGRIAMLATMGYSKVEKRSVEIANGRLSVVDIRVVFFLDGLTGSDAATECSTRCLLCAPSRMSVELWRLKAPGVRWHGG